MSFDATLVVMAAGMGSRFGGLKQIEPVGPGGQAIIDFSVYDAKMAGFNKVVFIIKHEIEKEFKEMVGARIEKMIDVEYAFQEIDMLPDGFICPEDRVKPWGTAHAIYCAREKVNTPFAVINADDYYGKQAFREIYNYLLTVKDGAKADFCMVGYRLGNTVTDNGSVARGVCNVDGNDYLTTIDERTRIEKYEGGIHFTTDDGATWEDLAADTPVSMNMWGFTASFLRKIEADFPWFFAELVPNNPAKAEMFLPLTVSRMLADDTCSVKVLRTADKWYGVTYAADKPVVVAALADMTQKGLYPDGLWK